MNKNKTFYLLPLVLLLLLNVSAPLKGQDARTQWFEEGRYGMFIHWGLYSAAEGIWRGENTRYLNNYAEWIRYRNRISKDDYGELARRFDWDKIDPEQWVLQAKKSGMKYIIITTKHHDGVAIWDTQVGDYSLPKLSGSNRDVIKEIADACRKHDMKLGFYYSHWIDWEHPYAWDHNQELNGRVSDAQFDEYWQTKAIPQMRELLTNYGDIAIMWFDMWIPYEKTIFKRKQLEQAVALIRELQPNCLINSRLGLPTDAEFVDFQTMGDNQFGSSYTDHPWETPGTIAHSWGYSAHEQEWKSTSQLFSSLLGNVSLNGGYTLNIGPRANGDIPYESIQRLDAIGQWLNSYGESVYGTTGLNLRPNQHDWGKVTYNAKQGNIYLHVFNWPLDKILRFTGLLSKPGRVELLEAGGKTSTLEYKQEGPIIHIALPSEQPNPYNSIVRIQVDGPELDKAVVGESTFGGFALNTSNTLNAIKDKVVPYDGKKPSYIETSTSELLWEVYIPRAGDYKLNLSAHNPQGSQVAVEIQFGKQVIHKSITPDSRVVAEPNEDNYTLEFVDRELGRVVVDKPGKVQVRLKKSSAEENILFNYLWIEEVQ